MVAILISNLLINREFRNLLQKICTNHFYYRASPMFVIWLIVDTPIAYPPIGKMARDILIMFDGFLAVCNLRQSAEEVS